MGNTLLTPTIIAKESLIVLENECVLANLVHRDYSKEFQKVGATVIVRKPTTFTSASVSDTVNMGTATESSVAVVLNQHLDVTFEVTTKELSLDIVDFSEQFIQPAMRAHAQKVDELIAGLYSDVAGHYPVSSSASVSDITNLRKVMNILKVPMSQRRCVVHPQTEAVYLPLEAFLHAEKRGDTRVIKEASMGRVLGFDWYMDQNIESHTTGGYGAATATITADAAGTVGGTAIQLKGGVAAGTINAGDIFKFSGVDEWHVAGAAATATDGSVTVGFQPSLLSAIADGATATFQQTHKANLAFHKNAFALVTAPLAPPIGGAAAGVLNYKGLSTRVAYDYTMMTKKNIISIDMLCGVKTLDRNLAARLSDAN